MAGKFRRKFIDIIFDTITKHYRGKVSEQVLLVQLGEIRKQIEKLEQCKDKSRSMRTETLKKLKKLPIEKLKEILVAKA